MPSEGAVPGLRRLLPDRIILTFHGLGTPGPEVSEAERPYWLDRSDLAAAIGVAAVTPGVEFTFDDGNRSDLDVALPLLVEAGATATFFVLAGRLGEKRSLRSPDLATLARAGMTVGSHGEQHLDWTQASDATLRRELHDARSRIEDAAGVAVRTLSVPFGRFDARVLRLAAEAGYARVHTSSGGLAGNSDWLVPRNTVRQGKSTKHLTDRLRGWQARVDSALRNPLRAWKHGAPSRVTRTLSTSPADRGPEAAAASRG